MIDRARLFQIYTLCLFLESEVDGNGTPRSMFLDTGDLILNRFYFHEGRYRTFEGEIKDMITQLQAGFFEPQGLTFLAMPTGADGEEWTDEMGECEILLALAMAGDYARFPIDRDLWPALVGAMPQIAFSLTPYGENHDQHS